MESQLRISTRFTKHFTPFMPFCVKITDEYVKFEYPVNCFKKEEAFMSDFAIIKSMFKRCQWTILRPQINGFLWSLVDNPFARVEVTCWFRPGSKILNRQTVEEWQYELFDT